MRAITLAKSLPAAVGALVALWVLPDLHGQAQSPAAATDPQPRSSGFPGLLAEPKLSISEYRTSGNETEATTPILHESVKLTASDADADDEFGRSISMSEKTIIVGAFRADCSAGINCGAAYVFQLDESRWVEKQKLTASDASANDWFGRPVTRSGDTVILGARRTHCSSGINCGAAYVFQLDESRWVEKQKLTASDASDNDWFGVSASLDGNFALVGAHRATCHAGDNCGAVYVFRFDGDKWVEFQKLTALDLPPSSLFGNSVSINGEVAIVGAPHDDCYGLSNCGSAYVFRFDGESWVEEEKVTASNASPLDGFGTSVTALRDTALVSAYGWGSEIGSVYVFSYDGTSWIELQRLRQSGAASRRFGWSVFASGGMALIGAIWDDNRQGGAYGYRFNGTLWIEIFKLIANERISNAFFGSSVTVSEERVAVGAAGETCKAGDRCGAVYVFDLPPGELEVAIDIKPGSDINPINLAARGVLAVAVLTTSVANGDLIDFDASDVDPSSLTLAGAAPRMKGRSGRVGSLVDIDGDGEADLLVHFPIADLDLTIMDTEAVLLGQTFDGTPIRGSDVISVRGTQRLGAEDLRRAE